MESMGALGMNAPVLWTETLLLNRCFPHGTNAGGSVDLAERSQGTNVISWSRYETVCCDVPNNLLICQVHECICHVSTVFMLLESVWFLFQSTQKHYMEKDALHLEITTKFGQNVGSFY